nr:MAG TPA: Baseplate wedge protein [Caudoviricetes sp.]
MANYGLTDNGFVIKRLDTILNEIHEELSDGFGIDTRISKPSFLDVLVTTFAGQIANLWEVAQDSYYAKYPSSATGVHLDNSIQYGGIRREMAARTIYPLHCTGIDGTKVRRHTPVATNTNPETRLYAINDFEISRSKFNSCRLKVVAVENANYSITINGSEYIYTNNSNDKAALVTGIANSLRNSDFNVNVDGDGIIIADKLLGRVSKLVLSSNLTTDYIVTISNFETEKFGKIQLPNDVITKLVDNIAGFTNVRNRLQPIYGREAQTDVELRQAYIAKSALRSNTMVDSVVAEILNTVVGIETVSGFENDTDFVNDRQMPPHSIEFVVEGGEDSEIASAILRKKAGGIQTYGSVVVDVPGKYGDSIPIKFNRPTYIYVWLKIVLHCKRSSLPDNYKKMVSSLIVEKNKKISTGKNLLIQTLIESLYEAIPGLTYVDIQSAYRNNLSQTPTNFVAKNVLVNSRQKIILSEDRIEVSCDEN